MRIWKFGIPKDFAKTYKSQAPQAPSHEESRQRDDVAALIIGLGVGAFYTVGLEGLLENSTNTEGCTCSGQGNLDRLLSGDRDSVGPDNTQDPATDISVTHANANTGIAENSWEFARKT